MEASYHQTNSEFTTQFIVFLIVVLTGLAVATILVGCIVTGIAMVIELGRSCDMTIPITRGTVTVHELVDTG